MGNPTESNDKYACIIHSVLIQANEAGLDSIIYKLMLFYLDLGRLLALWTFASHNQSK